MNNSEFTVGRYQKAARHAIILIGVATALAIGDAEAQEVKLTYSTEDNQQLQAFSRRGVPVDLMSTAISYVSLTPENRSVEVFREVADPVLVRTYDSLQVGAVFRNHVDVVLAIAADSLMSINFVLVDDQNGISPENAEGYTTIERDGRRYLWPATNISGEFDRQMRLPDAGSVDNEDGIAIVDVRTDLDPEFEAAALREEAAFWDQSADIYQELAEDATKRLPWINQSLGKHRADVQVSSALVDSLDKEAGDISELLTYWAGLSNAVDDGQANLPGPLKGPGDLMLPAMPDRSEIDQRLGELMDQIFDLGAPDREAEKTLQSRKARMNGVLAQRNRLRNDVADWNARVAEGRAKAELLRRRADGIESGSLVLSDYRSVGDTTRTVNGWTYYANVFLGSTVATELIGEYGGWDAWEGIILHRVLNSQLLDEGLVAARRYGSEGQVLKVGWSEIGFLGRGFEESELAVNYHVAFETGVGIFFGALHGETLRKKVEDFVTKNDPKYVFPKTLSPDRDLRAALKSGESGMSRYDHLMGSVANQTMYRVGDVAVGKLRWEEVPAYDLLRSSSSTSVYLLLVSTGWADANSVLGPLIMFLRKQWRETAFRDLPSLAQDMAIAFEETGMEGAPGLSLSKIAAGLMPLAYLDILTNFGLAQRDIYRLHGSKADNVPKPSAYEAYWTHIRPALRIGMDQKGLMLGRSSMMDIARAVMPYLNCAVEVDISDGKATPETLHESCWPAGADNE